MGIQSRNRPVDEKVVIVYEIIYGKIMNDIYLYHEILKLLLTSV